MGETEKKSQTIIEKFIAIFLGLPWVEILAEVWKYAQKVLRGMTSEGIYEVLDYEMFLEIHDEKGKKATYQKCQRVRYLQNNVIAYHDQAWGDGKILLNYRCSPGKAVDRYRSGHKTLILISLRQIRNRGDQDSLRIQWNMKNSFTRMREEWATSISHRTKKLKINVLFPAKRPPLKMYLIETNRNRQIRLGKDYLTQLPDMRWQVTWEKENPKLYEDYIVQWEW